MHSLTEHHDGHAKFGGNGDTIVEVIDVTNTWTVTETVQSNTDPRCPVSLRAHHQQHT